MEVGRAGAGATAAIVQKAQVAAAAVLVLAWVEDSWWLPEGMINVDVHRSVHSGHQGGPILPRVLIGSDHRLVLPVRPQEPILKQRDGKDVRDALIDYHLSESRGRWEAKRKFSSLATDVYHATTILVMFPVSSNSKGC